MSPTQPTGTRESHTAGISDVTLSFQPTGFHQHHQWWMTGPTNHPSNVLTVP